MDIDKFDYYIDIDLFDKEPYKSILIGDNELFPNTKPCFSINGSIFIYNKAIKILLTRKEIIVRNRINGKDEPININRLIEAYEIGFKEGEKYFVDTYNVSPDTMYGNQFKLFERTLHDKYYHSLVNGTEGGWRKYVVCFPFIITNQEIYKYGYYAGIVHQLELLKAKYSIPFRNFDKHIDSASPQQTETEAEQVTQKAFIANEYALAYIYDLFANGKQIPINRTDGGLNKKELINQGFELYQLNNRKDTFYRAVKYVSNFDLNKQQDLVNISQRWLEAVKTLSKNWDKTEKYLKEKGLIGE